MKKRKKNPTQKSNPSSYFPGSYFILAQATFPIERETGLEPATSSLGSWHSTTELLPRKYSLIRAIAYLSNDYPKEVKDGSAKIEKVVVLPLPRPGVTHSLSS